MIVGIGHDVFEVARMEASLRADDAGLSAAVFTPGEIAFCRAKRYPARHFAARFAAKEAVLKALGLGAERGAAWLDVEVASEPSGRPRVLLHGDVGALARAKGVDRVLLTASHTAALAAATVVLESDTPGEVPR